MLFVRLSRANGRRTTVDVDLEKVVTIEPSIVPVGCTELWFGGYTADGAKALLVVEETPDVIHTRARKSLVSARLETQLETVPA